MGGSSFDQEIVILAADFFVLRNRIFLRKNWVRIFSMRIGEKMFIYPWKGHLGYPSRPMAASPRHLHQCASCHFLGKGDFWKNRPYGGQKSILTTIGQIAQRPQNWSLSVPRGPIDPHLSWFGRRKLLGEYKKSTIFGDFGNFEASHKYGLYPPLNVGSTFSISEIDLSHLGPPYSRGRCKSFGP